MPRADGYLLRRRTVAQIQIPIAAAEVKLEHGIINAMVSATIINYNGGH